MASRAASEFHMSRAVAMIKVVDVDGALPEAAGTEADTEALPVGTLAGTELPPTTLRPSSTTSLAMKAQPRA